MVMHGRGSAVAVEPGRDRGRGGLARFAVAAFAAWAGFGGHDLGGLEQRPGQPVQLREDHLGVTRREVEQAPRLMQDIQAGQAQRVPVPAAGQHDAEVTEHRPVHLVDPVPQPLDGSPRTGHRPGSTTARPD